MYMLSFIPLSIHIFYISIFIRNIYLQFNRVSLSKIHKELEKFLNDLQDGEYDARISKDKVPVLIINVEKCSDMMLKY